LFLGIFGLISLNHVSNIFSIRPPRPTLQDQQFEIDHIVSIMDEVDVIFVHGATEILVLSELPNSGSHFFLDRAKDDFLEFVEPGGFYGWFDRLKTQRPRIVALSRLTNVSHADDFQAWVDSDYDKREGRFITYYLRRD
jgi:hypothetical protein